MPELGPYGSVRGARGNSRLYRDPRPISDTGSSAGDLSTTMRILGTDGADLPQSIWSEIMLERAEVDHADVI